MICDTLDQLHLYKGFHKNLDTAIEFLAAHPLDTLPLGRTEVDGDEVFINVMDADLKPHTGSRAEYHRLYADLQIDLTGGEGWGYETAPGTPMYITVTMKEVDELVACGVDILAVQGTGALRPDGSTSAEFIRAIKAKYPDQLVMADCDNFENAMACAEAGADFVGTTMRGYTPETQGIDDIDFDFVHKLATECPAKVIAEGHIHYPEQAVKALEAGAFALVVGGAITRPAEITARFTGAINAMNK